MHWQSPHNPSNTSVGTYLWSPVFDDEEEEPSTDILGSSVIALVPPDPPALRWLMEGQDLMAEIFEDEEEEETLLADSPQWPTSLEIKELPVDEFPHFVLRYYPTLEELTEEQELWEEYEAATFDSEVPFPGRVPGSGYSDRSCNILSEIQRHFLESTIDEGATWSLWTQAEVLKYLNDRLKRFYIETGVIRERQLFSASSRTVALPSDVMEVRRIIWWSSSNVPSPLTREDKWALDNGFPGWRTETGTPIAYVEEPQTTRSITLYPYTTGGSIEVCYVPYPETIPATCSPLPIPAMFSHVIKYGVMADMLAKEGEANDNERSKFFLQRWEAGLELAKLVVGRWKQNGSN